jgi:hypothetical protein
LDCAVNKVSDRLGAEFHQIIWPASAPGDFVGWILDWPMPPR